MKELNFSVNMDEFLPLRDVVFNTLRQAILRGELKPGERLMEIQLANKLASAGRRFEKRSESWNWKGLCLLFREKVLRWLKLKKRA